MTRTDLEEYILTNYGIEPDYPWSQYSSYAVFRHVGNKKWFAVVMSVPENKFGLAGAEEINVVNLKCPPILSGGVLGEKGIFPAYHMSKANWISVSLDGSVDDDKIKMLLDVSFDATAPKIAKKKN